MKRCIVPVFLLLGIALAKADIIPFDLSPPGTDKAVGLSPSNEVGTVIGSTGSGNEILSGITFDKSSGRSTAQRLRRTMSQRARQRPWRPFRSTLRSLWANRKFQSPCLMEKLVRRVAP